jgi:hypothetical protein
LLHRHGTCLECGPMLNQTHHIWTDPLKYQHKVFVKIKIYLMFDIKTFCIFLQLFPLAWISYQLLEITVRMEYWQLHMDMLEVMKEKVYTIGIFMRYAHSLKFHKICLIYFINVMGA